MNEEIIIKVYMIYNFTFYNKNILSFLIYSSLNINLYIYKSYTQYKYNIYNFEIHFELFIL